MSKSNFKENPQPTQERKANKEKEPLDNTTKLKSRQKKIPSDSKRKSSIGNENANIFEPKEEIIEPKENEENKVDSTEENIINLINESDKVNYLYNSKKKSEDSHPNKDNAIFSDSSLGIKRNNNRNIDDGNANSSEENKQRISLKVIENFDKYDNNPTSNRYITHSLFSENPIYKNSNEKEKLFFNEESKFIYVPSEINNKGINNINNIENNEEVKDEINNSGKEIEKNVDNENKINENKNNTIAIGENDMKNNNDSKSDSHNIKHKNIIKELSSNVIVNDIKKNNNGSDLFQVKDNYIRLDEDFAKEVKETNSNAKILINEIKKSNSNNEKIISQNASLIKEIKNSNSNINSFIAQNKRMLDVILKDKNIDNNNDMINYYNSNIDNNNNNMINYYNNNIDNNNDMINYYNNNINNNI